MLPLPQLKSRSGGFGDPMLTRSLSAYTAPSLEIGSSLTLPEEPLLKSLIARFCTRFCAWSVRTHACTVFPPPFEPVESAGPEVPQALRRGADRPVIAAADRKVRRERGVSTIRSYLAGGDRERSEGAGDRFSISIDIYCCRTLENCATAVYPSQRILELCPRKCMDNADLCGFETLR